MPDESTTPDLVELTRRLYETADAGDFDAMMRFFSADSVWDMSPEAGTFEGAPAIRRFVEDWQGSYEEYEAEVEDILDLGHGVTLAVSVQKGRPGASSGHGGSSGHVQVRFAAVYTWTEALIVRATTYLDPDEARAAAKRLAESRG